MYQSILIYRQRKIIIGKQKQRENLLLETARVNKKLESNKNAYYTLPEATNNPVLNYFIQPALKCRHIKPLVSFQPFTDYSARKSQKIITTVYKKQKKRPQSAPKKLNSSVPVNNTFGLRKSTVPRQNDLANLLRIELIGIITTNQIYKVDHITIVRKMN